MYYRAQTIIARKVLKEFDTFANDSDTNIFTTDATNHTKVLYEDFKNQSKIKMQTIADNNKEAISAITQKLANQTVHKVAESVLERVTENELITPKLSIILRDELSSKTH
jgi:S-adenosylmethionine synthetase